MPSTRGSYAVKKRKKPVRKSPKLQPPEGAKSNPSKRHRDRLNQELNKLTHLLPFPEDVRARLDKLSILRLIVGYLKVKGYFSATLKNSNTGCSANPPGNPGGSEHASPQINTELFSEGDLLLQALNGFLMAVTEDGYVFYVSPTVQDYLGFHQSDIIYQSVFELIHKEDRPMFQSQLRWSSDPESVSREAKEDTRSLPTEEFLPISGGSVDSRHHLPSEDPRYLERSFICRFRCLLDNSSGFLELNFHGHLKFLPGQNNTSEGGTLVSPQLTLFAIATPHQPLTILELQTKTFLFQTKHKLDFTPIACDSRGKVVLGYTESELCRRGSGYQFIHAADMMYCAENHSRLIRTGESGLTVFRLLTKRAGWLWVQSNAHLVFRGGQPDCIVARQRVLTTAEGEEHLHKRALQLPFTFTTGEAILYDSSLPSLPTTLPARKKSRAKKGPPTDRGPVHPESHLGARMQQDESMCSSYIFPTPQSSRLARWGPEDRCEDREEMQQEKGNSLLTLVKNLLEKDTEEQPDLCFTLQHLGVTDLDQHPWQENLLGVDSDPAGSQNCHLLPLSQEAELQREEGTVFHGGMHVPFPSVASKTPPPTLRTQTSLGFDHVAIEVTTPQNLGVGPSPTHAHPQHFLASGPATPGPILQSPLQNPPQQQPGHSRAAPLAFHMSKRRTISHHRDVASPLPKASSSRQAAQMFEPSCTAALSLGENVLEHLAQPAPGVVDFCQESVPQMPLHSGQCQEPLVTSDPALYVSPCGSHLSGSIWDSPMQGQPTVVTKEVGPGQVARQAWPDSLSHQWVVPPWLSWPRPSEDIPPNLGRGQPFSVPRTPEETTRGGAHPLCSLRAGQLSGSPPCPSQELLHGPSTTQGSHSAALGTATEQQQWAPVRLQTEAPCRRSQRGIPRGRHLSGHLRDATPQAPWLSPFPSFDSDSGSPGTGGSRGPAEPPRQCQDRLLGPASGALGRPRGPSSLTFSPCPPDPAWPPTSLQGSCDVWL